VEADGKPVWEKTFVCGSGTGEWKQSQFMPEWGIWQAVYDRDYSVDLPGNTHIIEVRNVDGDWLTLTEVGFQTSGQTEAAELVLRPMLNWGEKQEPIQVVCGKEPWAFETEIVYDRDWLWKTSIEPWKKLESMGVGVMVGEWGAHNKTPHEVVLRWMEDCLSNWRRAGWGWALWNFRGACGVLDSGREDVEFETWEGHQLDREMLDLLQKY
jgi:hypothetical protein